MNPAHQLSAPGFAVGQLGQIEPQIGFFVNSTTLLSLVGRLQYVTGLNGENALRPERQSPSATRSPSSAPSWRARPS